ncbi:hypothetical protein Zm00014a_015565 [Zea mays]|uniref:Uncharacterized protein n=1 Tax=Zea mays TaxID=4577 RepID=A0A3L6F3W1_MAIZE|nr:hypothetical protein Zm00014a_015565 [Zea mays]
MAMDISSLIFMKGRFGEGVGPTCSSDEESFIHRWNGSTPERASDLGALRPSSTPERASELSFGGVRDGSPYKFPSPAPTEVAPQRANYCRPRPPPELDIDTALKDRILGGALEPVGAATGDDGKQPVELRRMMDELDAAANTDEDEDEGGVGAGSRGRNSQCGSGGAGPQRPALLAKEARPNLARMASGSRPESWLLEALKSARRGRAAATSGTRPVSRLSWSLSVTSALVLQRIRNLLLRWIRDLVAVTHSAPAALNEESKMVGQEDINIINKSDEVGSSESFLFLQ